MVYRQFGLEGCGVVLPSTGGAGRVAIYVIGAILVIGGGIVLVTKKRVR